MIGPHHQAPDAFAGARPKTPRRRVRFPHWNSPRWEHTLRLDRVSIYRQSNRQESEEKLWPARPEDFRAARLSLRPASAATRKSSPPSSTRCITTPACRKSAARVEVRRGHAVLSGVVPQELRAQPRRAGGPERAGRGRNRQRNHARKLSASDGRASDQTALRLRRRDEAGEQRMRLERPRLQLRVKLHPDEPGMVHEFDRLRQQPVRRHAGKSQAPSPPGARDRRY